MAVDESQVYRDLMRLKPDDLTSNAWAIRAGVSRTVWSDMRRHGNPSRRTLEKLLVAVSSSLAEFEALRLGDQPVTHSGPSGIAGDPQASPCSPAHLPPLPLMAATLIGGFGDSGSDIALVEIG